MTYTAKKVNGDEIRTIALSTHVAVIVCVVTLAFGVSSAAISYGIGARVVSSELRSEVRELLRETKTDLAEDIGANTKRIERLEARH